ncbi:unnamed protein product [Closterium sp. NIES-64]|nr:unnamed protein product [Closterium sp. NIES-64]
MQEIFMDRGGKARDGLSGPDVMSGKSAGMSENGGMRNEEEPEDEDQPQCRICLETDGRDLIAPCRCKGSARFVHRHCLDQWRATKEGFAFCHCSTCKARFQLRVCLPPDLRCRHLKFRFFVARDIVLITLLVQMLIICFGYTAYVADYYWFDMGFQKTWDRQSPAAFYYICGVLLFLVSAGLLGAVMTCVDRRFRSDLAAPCRDLGACCCNPLVCGSCDCHVAPICLYSDCSGCSFCFSGCSDCAAAIGGCTGEAGLLILLTLGAILLVVLIVVGLAPSHAALAADRVISAVDFHVGKRSRLEMEATGKNKQRATPLDANSALCKIVMVTPPPDTVTATDTGTISGGDANAATTVPNVTESNPTAVSLTMWNVSSSPVQVLRQGSAD